MQQINLRKIFQSRVAQHLQLPCFHTHYWRRHQVVGAEEAKAWYYILNPSE